ncbi:signal transducer and activator of transcription 5B-like [Oppia nitens]|uniref:signal transducer and activator of transcription 5B-like n=1 Tax=Oppia nitens TaxID=1686743 RepID=UPI0023DA08DF|nr:signal transducer and activator of transcription 5B-like [Oppia nitens]
MSIWAQLQELPEEAQQQVHMAYGDQFPIEVRCALAQWIEEKPWKDLDPDNPQHEAYASSLVTAFIQEIEAKANLTENFVTKFKLNTAAQNFRQSYLHTPFILVRIVKHCLSIESRVIQQAQNYLNISNHETKPLIRDPQQEITQQLEKLRKNTIETDEELRRMQQEQEQFIIQFQENQKRQLTIQQLNCQPNQNIELISKWQKEKDSLDAALKYKAAQIYQTRTQLIQRYSDTLTALQSLQQRVLDDELIHWKRAQQLCGNAVPFENNLDQIQEWCETLAESIWANRQQMKRLADMCQQLPLGGQPSGHSDQLQNLTKQITTLLSNLVTSTFIIEKQPPQVMKTNTRFTSTVRLLVGGKLNVNMTPPQVKVTIISESQANAMIKNDKVSMGDVSGEILNNSGTMEYHSATRQLSVNFRNMQLRKIKRAEKKGTESVMDEKFSLLFQSQFKVGGGELVFQVWTLSLPVVVIVHGNQEPHAWATVTWDNAFAAPGRQPFVVPEKVPFSQVGEVLSQKFKGAVGRGLSDDNLRFLAGKAFRNPNLQDWQNQLLSWSLFSKEPLPDRSFTFWEWFYAILKVTREHLRGLWNDGSIMGFVWRRQAEEMLSKKPSGTFLLRFSDSELGGVTVAWIAEGQEGNETYMLQPFTSRDFQIRGLADRINDLKHLTYLYPDIPKDQAFSKYYTPFNDSQPSSSNGYVKPVLVTFIPGWSGNGPYDSYPNTPQSALHNPHSPSDVSYHDNPSVQSSSNDCALNAVGGMGGTVDDYSDLMSGMDLVTDMDVPVDFSSINVSDLMAYSKSS